MFKDFLLNVTVLISFFACLGQLIKNDLNARISSYNKKLIWGGCLGLLGIVLMMLAIRITDTTIADLRHIAMIIAVVYGGMPAAIISGVMIALGRLLLFGWSEASVVATISMLAIAIVCGALSLTNMSRLRKAMVMNLIALLFITIALTINVKHVSILFGTLTYHYVFSLAGGALAFYVAEFIWKANQSELELKGITEKYQSVVDNVKEVIFQIDIKRNWQFLNPAWTEMTGYSVEESLGTDYLQYIHADDREHFQQVWIPLIHREIEYCRHVVRFTTKEGKEKWIEVFARLTVDGTGEKYIGISGTMNDVTDRKHAEEALMESNEKYKTLATLSPDGIMVHSQGKIIFVNQVGVQLLGGATFKDFIHKPVMTVIHSDSSHIVQERINHMYSKKEQIHLAEMKFVRVDRSVIDVEVSSTFIVYNGLPSIMVVYRDISSRKKMERAIRESELKFRLLAEYSSDIISLHDLLGNYRYVSPACKEVVGFAEEEMLGKSSYDFIHPDDIPNIRNNHKCLLETGHIVSTYRIRTKTDEYIWLESNIKLLDDIEGRSPEIIVVSRNISERKLAEEKLQEANEMLKRLSTIDGLTGVANRRFFDEAMNREWAWAMRDSAPLSLIMADIDYFKAYNDLYGHQGGDEVLKQVAQAISGCLRRSADAVCRYGGEEFSIILPQTSEEDALAAAENIRKAVEALHIPHAGSKASKHITISLGVATVIPAASEKYEELIHSSDKALYQAKNSGRNQVNMYQRSPESRSRFSHLDASVMRNKI